MIKAELTKGLPKSVGPKVYPFLWMAQSGCIYLRNADGRDIIICPRVCNEKLGKMIPDGYYSTEYAWGERLTTGATVTLTQE